MHSIVAACLTGEGGIRATAVATAVAARTGAAVRWTTAEAAAEELRRSDGRFGDEDLILLEPRVPEDSEWLGHDRDAAAIVHRAAAGVLVVRGPLDWPPRRALVVVDRVELDRGTLVDAAAWVVALAGERQGGEGLPIELAVLHVTESPDAIYRQNGRLVEQLDVVRRAHRGRIVLRTIHCGRWGAHPQKRVIAAIRSHQPTLVVMSRSRATGEFPGLLQGSWFQVAGMARCPVLLLPRVLRIGESDTRGRSDIPSIDAVTEAGDEWDAPPRAVLGPNGEEAVEPALAE